MARRAFSTLRSKEHYAGPPGSTVDLRGTTSRQGADERKEILLDGYRGGGVGSYFGGYSAVTGVPGRAWSVQRAFKEGFSRDVYIYRAVKTIAVDQSRLRFGVRAGDLLTPGNLAVGRVELTDDPLIQVLNVRANPLELAFQFRERCSVQWHLSPRGGFIEKMKTKGGRIYEARLLPPMRTRIVPEKQGGGIDHFELDPPFGMGKPRSIDPDMVTWFREPHPFDPFLGMTALEAAGLDIEMEYFARLFNRQSMANDGRPGGIVGVTGPDGKGEPADDDELDRVERKFGGGPVDAGRIVVLDGTVTYTDVANSPRDLQWAEARRMSKVSTLGALGVPESVALLNSSERTFSNAGQEWVDYWIHTQVPHSDAFALLWIEDVAGGVPFLDYNHIEALQGPIQARRAELRDEVDGGFRSRLSYAQETGQVIGEGPGEFPDVPATRAIWIDSGKTPIASNPEDQAELDKLTGRSAPDDGTGGGGVLPPGPGGPPALPPGSPPELDAGGGWPNEPAAGRNDGNLKALVARRAAERRGRNARALTARTRRPVHDDESEEDHRAGPAERALNAALTAMVNRQVARTLARINGTKARTGTRHWIPKQGEAPSTKQLDPADVVDPQQWYDQAAQTAAATLVPLALAQYQATEGQVEADTGVTLGELVALTAIAAVVVPGMTPAQSAKLPAALAAEVAGVVVWFATSAYNHGVELSGVVAEAEADDAARVAAGGASAGVRPVVDAVHEWAQGLQSWIQGVVPTSTAQAVEAGKHAVLGRLGSRVQREWRTRRDDKVREFHKKAEGQVQSGGVPFLVGGELLRYPRDPLGSPGNVINCFAGWTYVDAVAVEKVYRRWHEGEIVNLRTASGRVLAVTPNHPLLTDGGWVAAGALDVGDNLVGAPGGRLSRDAFVEPDVEHTPPTIEEVYDALALARDAVRVSGRAVDFHGDGSERDVDVVRADGELPLPDEAALCAQCDERVLTVADVVTRSLPPDRPAVQLGRRRAAAPRRGRALRTVRRARPHRGAGHAAAPGDVRGSGELPALLGGHPGHAGAHRVAAPPDFDTRLGEPSAKRLTGYAAPSREDLHALTREVELDEVVEVVRDGEFRGHVYNLECDPDIYLAGGLVAHNCRCRTRWRLRPEQKAITEPDVVAALLAQPAPRTIEGKASVDHVRTPEGVARFDLPIGSPTRCRT